MKKKEAIIDELRNKKHTIYTQNNSKMAEVNPSLSVVTLNVNRLNSST